MSIGSLRGATKCAWCGRSLQGTDVQYVSFSEACCSKGCKMQYEAAQNAEKAAKAAKRAAKGGGSSEDSNKKKGCGCLILLIIIAIAAAGGSAKDKKTDNTPADQPAAVSEQH